MKPKTYPNKYCATQHYESATNLIPHVNTIQGIDKKRIYHIDHWYCPVCGLMYHFKDLERIIEPVA